MRSLVKAVAVAASLAFAAQYTVVDSQGHVVGTLVTGVPLQTPLQVIGITNGPRRTTPTPSDPRADRTFHPDFSKALTVDQMNRAWQDELDRINPPVVTGGG